MEGHAATGLPPEPAFVLGAARAAAVRRYLIALGVAPERISTVSYGSRLPLCRDDTDECRKRNARVWLAPYIRATETKEER